jgi:hypothetical protein
MAEMGDDLAGHPLGRPQERAGGGKKESGRQTSRLSLILYPVMS